MRTLVLASTSPYRHQLLQQLQLPFIACAPKYKETIDQTIAPELVVKHLAQGKAQSLAKDYPEALIIGSDQVFVDARGRVLGKPRTPERAVEQLRMMSGNTHTFYTGLVVIDSVSGETLSDFSAFSVTLRDLSDEEIRAYVGLENPVDCAGSFKIEGLGISLMEKMEGEDYTSLIGLPLIKLNGMLRYFGVNALLD